MQRVLSCVYYSQTPKAKERETSAAEKNNATYVCSKWLMAHQKQWSPRHSGTKVSQEKDVPVTACIISRTSFRK